MSEPHLRPLERVEELHLKRQLMEFLFRQGSTCTFMNPNAYEQIEVSGEIMGPAEQFLQPGMEVPIEFLEGEPISAVLPDIMEARVLDTAPPARFQQDSAWKEATLDNGLVIRVPLRCRGMRRFHDAALPGPASAPATESRLLTSEGSKSRGISARQGATIGNRFFAYRVAPASS